RASAASSRSSLAQRKAATPARTGCSTAVLRAASPGRPFGKSSSTARAGSRNRARTSSSRTTARRCHPRRKAEALAGDQMCSSRPVSPEPQRVPNREGVACECVHYDLLDGPRSNEDNVVDDEEEVRRRTDKGEKSLPKSDLRHQPHLGKRGGHLFVTPAHPHRPPSINDRDPYSVCI